MPEQDFWSCSENQANYLIFLKVKVMRMIVYNTCNPLNFLYAPFSLKEPPNLLDYYKLNWRKSENMKIRQLPNQNQAAA